jgi:hypothetical protein
LNYLPGHYAASMNSTGDDRTDRDKDLYWDYVKSEDNEILVARQYTDLVEDALRGLGIYELKRKDDDEALGLTLLAFKEPSDAVRARLADVDGAIADDLVGMVLNAVKYSFTCGQAGRWVPTMGRNRLVGHVDGTNGNVIVRDDNDPEPAAESNFRQTLASVQSSVSGSEVSAEQVIRVSMIDTTLRPHPFLDGKRITPDPVPFSDGGDRSHARTDTPGEKTPPFRAGHGTFVAGLVLGSAPNAELTVDNALNDAGRGTSWDIAKAILRCAKDGAQIINLSLACYTFDGLPPLVFSQAISRLPADTLVIAAAGNMANRKPPAGYTGKVPDLSQAPAWPAALDNVVAVGAADWTKKRAEFSPKGGWVDVRAPGVEVVSIFPGGLGQAWPSAGGYAKWSGTSFSAAEVTGAVAARAATSKDLTPRDAYLQLLRERSGSFTFLTSGI